MSSAICRNISNTSFSASSFQKGLRSMKKDGLRAKKITMSNRSFLAVKERVNIVDKRNVYSPVFAQGVRRNMGGKVNMTA